LRLLPLWKRRLAPVFVIFPFSLTYITALICRSFRGGLKTSPALSPSPFQGEGEELIPKGLRPFGLPSLDSLS
jgi:hypothetical protein